MNLNPIAKAVAAGVVSALSVLYTLTGVVNAQLGLHEWIAVALAFLAGLGFTYSVPNTPPAG